MTASVVRTRNSVGILAFGSLMADPGDEIRPLVARRIETVTPFPVEYGRFSATRGGGPTAVPHPSGYPVKAAVLALAEGLLLAEARNILWRRETRTERSGKIYVESKSANAVVIRDLPGFCGLAHILYTDFHPEGKIAEPDPQILADAAIASVRRAKPGKDGISYLIGLLEAGVETALTRQYVAEIVSRTGACDLADALHKLKTSQQEGLRNGQS